MSLMGSACLTAKVCRFIAIVLNYFVIIFHKINMKLRVDIDEHTRADKALRMSEERHRFVFVSYNVKTLIHISDDFFDYKKLNRRDAHILK